MRKVVQIIITSILIFGMCLGGTTAVNQVHAKAGDDPGVTITSPDTISSRQQVELKVTLSASAGKLDQDGKIEIKIPKNSVAQKNDLTNNLILGDPFYLLDPALTEDSEGNYVLNVAYDHTKIEPNEATGETFTIKYQAPVYKENDENVPDNVKFQADLSKGDKIVSQDTDQSKIQTDNSGLPLLSKFSTRPHKTVDGVSAAVMSMDNPASNIFAIVVNYNQQNVKNAVLRDKTPEKTELHDPGKYIPVSGDKTPVQHIQIAKVTDKNETGNPIAWKFVTADYADKITSDKNGFAINFGDLTPKDSFVVMYAEKVEDGSTADTFGVKTNTAILESNGSTLRTATEPLTLDSSNYHFITLSKKVSQSTISTTKGTFVYSLTAKAKSGNIPAGTKIVDPLPDYTTFDHTVKRDNEAISEGEYDAKSHTVTYTVLKDIIEGTNQTIDFQVDYSNPMAKQGDEVTNKAYINYEGTNIYSNDATTTLEGSAILKKIDARTKDPLAGAVFKVVDASGKTVKKELKTDGDGLVKSGLLAPGKYRFIETKAPAGYILDPSPVHFEVQAGAEGAVHVSKENIEATSVSGTKTWQDNHDKAGKRPTTITIKLYQNGKYFKSKKVDEKMEWKYLFDGLPKYDKQGKQYTYTVKEKAVKGYQTIQDGFDFTNKYIPIDHSVVPPHHSNPDKPKDPDPAGNRIHRTIENHLPATGDALSVSAVALGLVILAAAAYILRKKYKQYLVK